MILALCCTQIGLCLVKRDLGGFANMSQEFVDFLKSVDSPQVVKDADLIRIAVALGVCIAFWIVPFIAHALALARQTTFQARSS